jgi:hypothetical protein
MVNRNSFYNCFNDNFKRLTWLLIFTTAIIPNFLLIQFANASAAELWTIEEVVYDNIGKNLDYTAKKVGTAANDVVYKARVPVSAAATGSTVASMIRMGIAGALVYGIVEGVGWVIENGVVKKRDPSQSVPNSGFQYLWNQKTYFGRQPSCGGYFQTSQAAVANIIGCLKIGYPAYADRHYCELTTFDLYTCHAMYAKEGAVEYWQHHYKVSRDLNPSYNPSNAPSYIPVSDNELGEQVNQSPNAPQILPDVYNPNNPAGGEAPSKTREALDNANPEPVTQPEGETSPRPNVDTDGDGEPDEYSASEPTAGSTFKLPKFCEWAPAVCDFFTVQKKANTDFKDNQTKAIDQDKTFFEKVTEFFTWSKEEPLPDDSTSLQVEQHSILFDDSSKISFSNSCPVPELINIDFQGISQNLEFSYSPLCNFLDMIRPFVIAASYLIGAYIVMGLSRGSAD